MSKVKVNPKLRDRLLAMLKIKQDFQTEDDVKAAKKTLKQRLARRQDANKLRRYLEQTAPELLTKEEPDDITT